MEKTNTNYEIDLLQVLRRLWQKVWVIALAALIGGGAAFSYSAFLVPPLYEADAQMYVNNTSFSVGSTSLSLTELSAAQSLVDTYIVILNSRDTLNEIISTTGVKYDYKQLQKMLSAESVNNTEVFSITVTSDDPQEAELIANAVVDILPNRIADIVDGSSVRVVHRAIVPTEKASPNVTLFTAIGMVVGTVIACLALIILMVSDTLIHNEDYLMETYDLPVLAVIPYLYNNSGDDDYGTSDMKERRRENNG